MSHTAYCIAFRAQALFFQEIQSVHIKISDNVSIVNFCNIDFFNTTLSSVYYFPDGILMQKAMPQYHKDTMCYLLLNHSSIKTYHFEHNCRSS